MTKEYGRFVLLDRDGVINVAPKNVYVTSREELTLLPSAAEAIRALNGHGFGVLVVSNQQCVGKGLLTTHELDELSAHLAAMIQQASGGEILEFFYCPHLADDGCDCRKPKPGLILQAHAQFGFDFATTYLVGDSYKDLEAANAAGCSPILVLTGNDADRYKKGELPSSSPALVADNLLHAAEFIINRAKD